MLGTHRKFGGNLYLRVAWHEKKGVIDDVARDQKLNGSVVKVFKNGDLWYLYRRIEITSPEGMSYPVSKKGNWLSKLFYGRKR